MIKSLIEKKFAYESDGHVYFSVTSFKKYGKLQESFPATMSLMGIRTDRVNPTLNFKYSIANYQKRIGNAGYQFKDLVNDYGLVTSEDLLIGIFLKTLFKFPLNISKLPLNTSLYFIFKTSPLLVKISKYDE